MPRIDRTVSGLLRLGLSEYEQRLEAALLAEFEAAYRNWPGGPLPELGPAAPARHLLGCVADWLERQHQALAELRAGYAEFARRHRRAGSDRERVDHQLDYARALGASRRQLRGDRRALTRWFGYDTLVERYQRREALIEQRLDFGCRRLGWLAARYLELRPADRPPATWGRLGIGAVLQPLLSHEGDPRVRIAAFSAVARAVRGLPDSTRNQSLDAATLQYIYRCAQQHHQPVWLQTEAVELLAYLSPEYFEDVTWQRLSAPMPGDDLFVRAHIAGLITSWFSSRPPLAALLDTLAADPSAHVRQALATGLARTSPESADVASVACVQRLADAERSAAVRIAALLTLGEWARRVAPLRPLAREALAQRLAGDSEPLVLRAALRIVADTALALEDVEARGAWVQGLEQAVDRLATDADALSVRRWAAQARERLWLAQEPQARGLHDRLAAEVGAIRPGRGRRLRLPAASLQDEVCLGRVLALLAEQDFGLDAERTRDGLRIWRGERFGRRLWRILHELRHPSPDKRQAHPHTIGRIGSAPLRAPSAVLCEMVETKVPGEPLYQPVEDGWRPYLPLPDDALSSIQPWYWPRRMRYYTAQGITELIPPRGALRRVRSAWHLNRQFAAIAELRNWQEGTDRPAGAYVERLQALGFTVAFHPHGSGGVPEDPAVRRFFPALLPLPGVDLWQRAQEYFVSVYQNSLAELGLFAGAVMAWFLARQHWMFRQIRQARAGLPLVIGGWGTRGKSGTERLKAALLNARGYSVFSKTTGCEAMFLYGHPYGRLHELFLFRPYDKATIWEQGEVVRMAARLRSQVFLWECMGLNPDYVNILQRHWMRDDLATITNAYPDHEDLQGPAGHDIPRVMTRFIPARSTLLTSEELMRPILADSAHQVGTRMHSVGWLEAAQLTPDVLERFPYAEHPYNVALVCALAAQLGMSRDFALKEMADRVVPDLGVLRSYPLATLRTRRIEFANGMSANERYGCLSNWRRLGFDLEDPLQAPEVWVSTVVNNRADRVPRSRVFAGILVEDICADRHLLIGTNLGGLRGYIAEAWDEYAAGLTLWAAGTEPDHADALRRLQAQARRQRVMTSSEALQRRVRPMLLALVSEAEARDIAAHAERPEALIAALPAGTDPGLRASIRQHLDIELNAYRAYEALREALQPGRAPDREALDQQFRAAARGWFWRKIVVIEDAHASGEQIIQRLCDETPPGFHNRAMGLQNIKGTGLDFIYQWQDWLSCHRATSDLLSDNPAQVRSGLQALLRLGRYNLLCDEFLSQALAQARESRHTQQETAQAELTLIASRLERARQRRGAAPGKGEVPRWLATLVDGVEAFLDAGDAVRRRKRADRIYRDLTDERITVERAAAEVQALNRRQKGHWLLATLLGRGTERGD